MTAAPRDLWPEDLGRDLLDSLSPYDVLHEQARYLSQRMDGLIYGDVDGFVAPGGGIRYTLMARGKGNIMLLSVPLVVLYHDQDKPFPCRVRLSDGSGTNGDPIAHDHQSLSEILTKLFASKYVRSEICNLVLAVRKAQTNNPKEKTDE